MTPSRRLFLVTWIASLVLLGWIWQALQHDPVLADALADSRGDLLTLSAVMVVIPWIAGPGLLPYLRRRESGGVNVPYAEYWFTGERRAGSLNRLAPYLDALGLATVLFLSVVLALWVGERWDPKIAAFSATLFLLVTIGFLASIMVLVRAILKAFPAPDAGTRGRAMPPARRVGLRPRRADGHRSGDRRR